MPRPLRPPGDSGWPRASRRREGRGPTSPNMAARRASAPRPPPAHLGRTWVPQRGAPRAEEGRGRRPRRERPGPRTLGASRWAEGGRGGAEVVGRRRGVAAPLPHRRKGVLQEAEACGHTGAPGRSCGRPHSPRALCVPLRLGPQRGSGGRAALPSNPSQDAFSGGPAPCPPVGGAHLVVLLVPLKSLRARTLGSLPGQHGDRPRGSFGQR